MSDSTTPQLWLQVPESYDLVRRFGTAVDVPAFGGRLEVDWSPGQRITSVGGLVYFATFLKETGLFDRLCEDFPISYRSNNSSSRRDIVGTAVLAILLGKTRYVHIEAIRHDEAARELLGLGEIVSDATVRRAFRRANEKRLDDWLLHHEREVFEALLAHKYIVRGGGEGHSISLQDQAVAEHPEAVQGPVRRQRMEGLRIRLGGAGAADHARRVASESTHAVHTASSREEGRARRAEEARQEAEGPEEVDCARPDGPRSREAGGV